LRVGIATVQVPFVRGGAEALAASLQATLQAAGHEAEIISMPFKWYPTGRIPDHMLAARLMQVEESCGQRIDRLIGLKFPAYLMPHPSKRLWLLHQYRSAYDLWDQSFSDLRNAPDGSHIRAVIQTADTTLLPECERLYTLSRTVSARLLRFNGIAAEPLYHPPPDAANLRCLGWEDYILFPSRINESKRQHLAIEALALTRERVRLVFLGASDAPQYDAAVRARCSALRLNNRVAWCGQVGHAEKLELYGRSLAVVFPPLDEDYGYVTLEAMLCGKAVVTASDSGGPLDFVRDGVTGAVCDPTPAALAAAFDLLWDDRTRTRALGEAGRQRYADLGLSWDHVLDCLVG
jgi:glycosyltransferase involved in cell wall biosynthesis